MRESESVNPAGQSNLPTWMSRVFANARHGRLSPQVLACSQTILATGEVPLLTLAWRVSEARAVVYCVPPGRGRLLLGT